MTEFSPFSCPIFLGPPKSEWLLLPKRAAALWEGTQMLLRAEPGKQRPRSCRTQELARSRGPRKRVAEKGWLTRLDESQYVGRTTSTDEGKKNRPESRRPGTAISTKWRELRQDTVHCTVRSRSQCSQHAA